MQPTPSTAGGPDVLAQLLKAAVDAADAAARGPHAPTASPCQSAPTASTLAVRALDLLEQARRALVETASASPQRRDHPQYRAYLAQLDARIADMRTLAGGPTTTTTAELAPAQGTDDDYWSALASASSSAPHIPTRERSGNSGGGGGRLAPPAERSKNDEYLALLAEIAKKKAAAQQQLGQQASSLAVPGHDPHKATAAPSSGIPKAPPSHADGPPKKSSPSQTPPTAPSANSGASSGGNAPPPMPSSLRGSIAALGASDAETRATAARNAALTLSDAGARFAPKTSAFVLKGIDVSAALMAGGRVKQAVDVLQHAYDVGRLEAHNSAGFEAMMRSAVLEARRKYYRDHPPRLLQNNVLAPDELALLRRSGHTNTALFPIWDDVEDGYAAENVYFPDPKLGNQLSAATGVGGGPAAKAWEDPHTPLLSDKQRAAGAVWARAPAIVPAALQAPASTDAPSHLAGPPPPAAEGVPPAISSSEAPTTTDPAVPGAAPTPIPAIHAHAPPVGLITTCDPLAIKQTIVGDCSLVCSLIACASYQRRFPGAKILSNVIYPQELVPTASGDGSNSSSPLPPSWQPVLSPNGKYCVKMLLNGMTRVVVIDDRLPVVALPPPQPPKLACSFSTDPREMWVSLLEKAFVKVCGGTYDFPGSNSSTDLYHLAGWLPDYLALDDPALDKDLQWQRLCVNHGRGALIATLNTPSNMDKSTAESLQLVPGHAYAVLEFRTTTQTPTRPAYRLVKIKNPWTSGNSWSGLFSSSDTTRMTPELRAELGYRDEDAARGVFWMTWQDVTAFFSRVHLSWNPYSLFTAGTALAKPTRIARHARWIYTAATAQKPQFAIVARNTLGRRSRLHLVLSRHITNLDEYRVKAGKREQDPPAPPLGSPFEECPQGRPASNAQRGQHDPTDYVPLVAVDIYEVTDYPSCARVVATLEAEAEGLGGGAWPPQRLAALLPAAPEAGKSGGPKVTTVTTPLGTVITSAPPGPQWAALGATAATTALVGRRIYSGVELPLDSRDGAGDRSATRGTLVHRGVYKNASHQTISFDLHPRTTGDGTRHFTAVVSQLLPEGEREGRPAAFPALRDFSFSLSLHSELPMADTATTTALLARPNPAAATAGGPGFIQMTTVPDTQLPFVSRAKGHWVGGLNCGGPLDRNTFGYNPQFLLTIPPLVEAGGVGGGRRLTHLIARLAAPNATEPVKIAVARLRSDIGALAAGDGEQGGGGVAVPPWYGRIGQLSSDEAEVVLHAPKYSKHASVIDTSLPLCLAFETDGDDGATIVRGPPIPLDGAATIPSTAPVAAATSTPAVHAPSASFYLPVALRVVLPGGNTSAAAAPPLHPQLPAAALLLSLLADGVLVAPAITKIVVGGQPVPLDRTPLGSLPEPLQQQLLRTAATNQDIGAVFSRVFGGLGADTATTTTALYKMITSAAAVPPPQANDAPLPPPPIRSAVVVPGNVDLTAFVAGGGSAATTVARAVDRITKAAGRILALMASSEAARLQEAAASTASGAAGPVAFSIAASASFYRQQLQLQSTASSPAAGPAGVKEAAALEEELTQIVLLLDSLGVAAGDGSAMDDSLRAHRKALVSAVEGVLIPALEAHRAAPPTPAPAAPPAAVPPTPTAPPTATTAPAMLDPPLCRLPPGHYVIVLSQWRSGKPAPFELTIETEVPHTLRELPPEGCCAIAAPPSAPSTPGAGAVAGYTKWPTSAVVQSRFVRDESTAALSGQMPVDVSALRRGPVAAVATHPLLGRFPSVSLFVPTGGGADKGPLWLGVRALLMAPPAAEADRPLPSQCIGTVQVLLFAEKGDGEGQLIADSGRDLSALDACAIATSAAPTGSSPTGKGHGDHQIIGAPSGSTRVAVSAQLAAGRRYRAVILVRPSATLLATAASLQFPLIIRVFSNVAGVTTTAN